VGRTGTRYKIKYQAQSIDRYFERIIDSVKDLSDVAAGRSEIIDRTMPEFLMALDACQMIWGVIRGRL
jgi:hypothetical protein